MTRELRVAVVNPNTTRSMTDAVLASARPVARPGTVLVGITPRRGVASVESPAEEARAACSVLEEVVEAEASDRRPDGYVVACFGDTGVAAARQVAAGPVVGMTEAALTTAVLVAHRFTVITLPRRTLAQSDRVVRDLGLGHLCTVRAVDEPVAAVAHGSTHLLQTFVDVGRRALDEDDAQAVVLGCAGLADLAGPLQEVLGVPVIEGVAAAVTQVEGLLAQGVGTSRVGTWAPATVPVTGEGR